MTLSTKYSLYGFEKLLPVGAKCIPLGKMWEVRFQNAYIYKDMIINYWQSLGHWKNAKNRLFAITKKFFNIFIQNFLGPSIFGLSWNG